MVMVDLVVLVVLEEDTIITIHPRMVILLTDHTAAATDHHMEEEDGISRVRRKVTPWTTDISISAPPTAFPCKCSEVHGAIIKKQTAYILSPTTFHCYCAKCNISHLVVTYLLRKIIRKYFLFLFIKRICNTTPHQINFHCPLKRSKCRDGTIKHRFPTNKISNQVQT